MNLNETKKRYHYLDVLKLLAIAFVVLYHHGAKTLFPSFLSDIMSVLSVCAPMFFFVNGALLFNKELDLKKHTKKTLKLVFVILFWSVILTFLLMVVRGDYLSFYEFLDTVLYLKNGWIHYLWFFRALLIIYVLFPMFKLLFDNHRKYFYFIFSLLLVLSVGESFSSTLQVFFNEIFGENFLSKAVAFVSDYLNFYSIEFQNFTYAIAIFMLGGIFHLHHEKIKNLYVNMKIGVKVLFQILLLSLIVLMSIGLSWHSRKIGSTDAIWTGMSSWFTLVNILCFATIFCTLLSIVPKFLTTLASCTMAIFLIHIFVQEISWLIFTNPLNYIIWLMSYLFTLVISSALAYLINRFRHTRWFVSF